MPSLQSNLVSDKSSVKAPISKQGGTAGELAAAYVPKLLAEASSRRKAFFVNYSTFSSALRAYNASPMNSTCGTTFPPGQCSLGYTPPRSSQIRSETHLQGSPRGLNASTSKSAQLPRSIYAGVFPNVYHIWPQKRIALAGRGAKPRERQYAS